MPRSRAAARLALCASWPARSPRRRKAGSRRTPQRWRAFALAAAVCDPAAPRQVTRKRAAGAESRPPADVSLLALQLGRRVGSRHLPCATPAAAARRAVFRLSQSIEPVRFCSRASTSASLRSSGSADSRWTWRSPAGMARPLAGTSGAGGAGTGSGSAGAAAAGASGSAGSRGPLKEDSARKGYGGETGGARAIRIPLSLARCLCGHHKHDLSAHSSQGHGDFQSRTVGPA